MPTGPTDTAWRSLLNACWIHGDLDLTERALEEMRRLGAANAGDYVIVADMHARAKNWAAAYSSTCSIASSTAGLWGGCAGAEET